MCEPSPKHFVSSLGSRTSVLDISHPTVSIYTHGHTIENFEILNFFAFDGHHWRGVGFWLQLLVPVGCTYLCLLGVRTCSGPFRTLSKQQKCSRIDTLLQTSFLVNSQKTSLPPVEVSKTALPGLSTKLSGSLSNIKHE